MRVGDNLEFMDALHDANSATEALVYRPTTPILIVRFGFVVGVDLTTSGSLELQRTTHIADGTPSLAAAGGKSCDAGALLIGAVAYAEPDEGVIVKPGDYAHLVVSTGWGAGDFYPWIQFQKLNWDDITENAEYADATRTNRMTDGSTDL